MKAPRKVAIVMSRLRRLVSPEETWLLGLRAVLRRIQREGAIVLVGKKTAGADFIRRGCERLGIEHVVIDEFDHSINWGVVDAETPPIPQTDRAIVSDAEQIFVLGLRQGGNQHRLLRERLTSTPGSVLLIDLPNLQPPSAKEELAHLGAQFWVPTAGECNPFGSSAVAGVDSNGRRPIGARPVVEISPIPSQGEEEWLFHTTRACPGPWPNTTFSEYVDSLLDADDAAEHSALGSLKRIACQRLLVASDSAIRGKHRVICFSACSLEELSTLHRFRRHRVRWDFEPYGIGIRRRWLEARGVRPVVYGDDAMWNSLSESDRPYFQSVSDGFDWSSEREWRHLGDLCLESLTSDDAVLIVPAYDDAALLSLVTDLPVTLWPQKDGR